MSEDYEDEEWSEWENEEQEAYEFQCSCGVWYGTPEEKQECERSHSEPTSEELMEKIRAKLKVQEVLNDAEDTKSSWSKIIQAMREDLEKQFTYELNSFNPKTRDEAKKKIDEIIKSRLMRLSLGTSSQGTHASKQMIAKFQERLLVMMSQLMAKKCNYCPNTPSFGSITESLEHLKKHHTAKYGEYSRLWKALEPDTSDIARIELSANGRIKLPESTEHVYNPLVEGITDFGYTETDVARKSIEEQERYSEILAELMPEIFGETEERKLPASTSTKAESCSMWEQLSRIYGELPIKVKDNVIYIEPIDKTKQRKKKKYL